MGTLHHSTDLDATRSPQLDILVHGTRRADLSFIADIDPFTMEFMQWMNLYRDMLAADSMMAALALVVMPPGWSPDGQGLTTEALRDNQARH